MKHVITEIMELTTFKYEDSVEMSDHRKIMQQEGWGENAVSLELLIVIYRKTSEQTKGDVETKRALWRTGDWVTWHEQKGWCKE